MAGKSAKKQNRGNNPTLYGTNVSGKEVDYHTIESARTVASFQVTGGDIADGLKPGNGYAYHCYSAEPLGVQDLTIIGEGNIEVLIVAGGGTGGSTIAGGGGAGGVLHGTIPVTEGTYKVKVGKGGYGPTMYPQGSGGEPSDFYESGASFPSPTTFARAYGGGSGGGYALVHGAPEYTPGTTWQGGGGAGGSGGGTGNQYGTKGAPGFSGKPSQPGPVAVGYTGGAMPFSPITPAPYDPSAPGVSVQTNPYGSDAPVGSPGEDFSTGKFNQSEFPSTYYMGIQGYGNYGGMAYGPSLDGGGAGGGGAGAAGEDRGSAPASNESSTVRGADGGTGMQFAGFTAPLFCDPTTPNGAAVKTALDPLGGYFAGGGGGSNYNATQGGNYGGGRGGDGGGGSGSPNGSPTTTFPPTTMNRPPNNYDANNNNAVFYSGGGGGGRGYSYGNVGSGAPGIVIIRYASYS